MLRRRPMARRMVGTMATTAVVAGTATAVSGRVARRQQDRAMAAESDEQMTAPMEPASPQPAYAPPAPPPAAPDIIEQLTQLAALKDQGVLTEEEFATQKARILGT